MSWARERKADVSVGWPPCTECPYKHAPGVECPPGGVWLVATLCGACRADTGHYCRRHSGPRNATR